MSPGSRHCFRCVDAEQALTQRYAVPLRQLAKDRDTQIIPTLEAERIFGNLGDILAANKLLLCELEMLHEQGPAALTAGVGDVLSQNVRVSLHAPHTDAHVCVLRRVSKRL